MRDPKYEEQNKRDIKGTGELGFSQMGRDQETEGGRWGR